MKEGTVSTEFALSEERKELARLRMPGGTPLQPTREVITGDFDMELLASVSEFAMTMKVMLAVKFNRHFRIF